MPGIGSGFGLRPRLVKSTVTVTITDGGLFLKHPRLVKTLKSQESFWARASEIMYCLLEVLKPVYCLQILNTHIPQAKKEHDAYDEAGQYFETARLQCQHASQMLAIVASRIEANGPLESG